MDHQLGFSTGHGSKITVSEFAMQKATKLLCDLCTNDTLPTNNETEAVDDDNFPPFEFSCSEINEVIDSVDTFMNTNCQPVHSQSSSSGFDLSASDTNIDDFEGNGAGDRGQDDISKANFDINVSELMPDDPCLNDFMDTIEKHENEPERDQERFFVPKDHELSNSLMNKIETSEKDEKRKSPRKSPKKPNFKTGTAKKSSELAFNYESNLKPIPEEEEIFNTQLELSNENIQTDEINVNFAGGFRTAAGQKLVPSEQALSAAKRLFGDFDCEQSDALEMAKGMLDDFDDFDEVAKQAAETNKENDEQLSMILSPIPVRVSGLRKQLNPVRDCDENRSHVFHSTPKNKREQMLDEIRVKKRKRLGTGGVKPMTEDDNGTVKKRLMCDETFDSSESYHKIHDDISQLKQSSGSRSILSTTARNDSDSCSQIVLDQNFIFKPKSDLQTIEASYRKQIDEAKMKISLFNNRLINFNLKLKIIETPPTPSYRKPQMGHLLKMKLSRTNCSNRLTLEHLNEMSKIVACGQQQPVSACLKNLTIENVSNFHFIVKEPLPGGIFRTVDDNFTLIPNVENRIGLTEIELAFKSAPTIDPTLLPKRWLENHYKQIVWKLTAYERFFAAYTSLNLDNLMLQLKYRYDREIDRAERSALRSILEKDEPASRRIVLCVSSIIKVNLQISELMLTDGWYSIRTVVDPSLATMIQRRKIFTGLKLIIHSAELINCPNGCNVLEIPDDVRLKIFYNCTRRARWTTKMGFQKYSIPFPITLQTIKSNGGPIGRLTVLITRIYPEKFLDCTNNSKVWRNKKAEESYCNEWENLRELKMQEICEKMQQNYENSRLCSRISNQSNIEPFHKLSDILCKRTLCQILYNSDDREALKEKFTDVQLQIVNGYWSEYVSNMQNDYSVDLKQALETSGFGANRNVRQVLTIRVTWDPCALNRDTIRGTLKDCNFLVTFWSNQSSSSYSELREGQIVILQNLIAKDSNLLSSTAYTKYEITKTVENFSENRKLTTIADLLSNNPNCSRFVYNEFDTIGILVKLDIQSSHQMIWLADMSSNLLLVRASEGTQTCLLISGLKIGEWAAILNLQRRSNEKNYAQATANQFTVFSKCLNTGLFAHLKSAFQQTTTVSSDFLNTCKTKIKTIVDD